MCINLIPIHNIKIHAINRRIEYVLNNGCIRQKNTSNNNVKRYLERSTTKQ